MIGLDVVQSYQWSSVDPTVQSYQWSSVDPTQHNSLVWEGQYCDILHDKLGVALDAAFGGQDSGDICSFAH